MANKFFFGLKNALCLAMIFWITTGSVVFALSHSLGKKDKIQIETQTESTVIWFEWNGDSLSVRTIDNHLDKNGNVLRSEGGTKYILKDVSDNPETLEIDETNISYTKVSPEIEALIAKIIVEIKK